MPVPQPIAALPVEQANAITAEVLESKSAKVNPNECSVQAPNTSKTTTPQAVTVFRLTDPSHKGTLEEVKLLAEQYFQEDFHLSISASPNAWRVDAAVCNETKALTGFVVYRRRAKTRDIGISKVYVLEAFRRHGIGRKLVKNVIEFAKKDKNIEIVSLCAFPHAVKFYQGLRFKAVSHTEGDEEYSEQTYMELRVRSARRLR
eukprot:comp21917_c1_seq1/m.31480 comp21917_c1_seq1/g.31480  ORF comp21917_c1_seq1/g.31480 comp21917_c1_seq1/m.31480 type:complete len:203 (-) comp21917_c1_seq1:651-1259(-)